MQLNQMPLKKTMDHWYNNCSLSIMTNYVMSDDEVSVTSFCSCMEEEEDLDLDSDTVSKTTPSSTFSCDLCALWTLLTFLVSSIALVVTLLFDTLSLSTMINMSPLLITLLCMYLETNWYNQVVRPFLDKCPVRK